MAHPVVLSDASPLIALALIDRLNLLHSLFGEVLITEVVKGEVLVGGDKPGETAIAAAIEASWIRVIADQWLEPQFPDLDEGEASTLRAAMHIGVPCLVLIDERVGRATARELGIPLSGTLGLIVQARKRGLIPSARAAFEQLLERDFRVATEMIREALVQVGEG
jgi:predicted nucleic acid-binding protein